MAHVGINKQFQIGKETTYGTSATPTKVVDVSSVSMKLALETSEDESLMISKTATSIDKTGEKYSGEVSFLFKPESHDLLLFAHGAEDSAPEKIDGTTGVYKHTITLSDIGERLPSFTAVIDKGQAIKKYLGCKFSNYKLDFKTDSAIKGSASINACDETTGTLETLPLPEKKAYKVNNAIVKINGEEYNFVIDASYEIDEGFYQFPKTFGSGYKYPEPVQTKREVKLNFSAFYDATMEGLRENYFKTGTTVSLEFTFLSPEPIEVGQFHKAVLSIPNFFIESCDADLAGKEAIKAEVSGKALLVGGVEPVTWELYDSVSTKY